MEQKIGVRKEKGKAMENISQEDRNYKLNCAKCSQNRKQHHSLVGYSYSLETQPRFAFNQ